MQTRFEVPVVKIAKVGEKLSPKKEGAWAWLAAAMQSWQNRAPGPLDSAAAKAWLGGGTAIVLAAFACYAGKTLLQQDPQFSEKVKPQLFAAAPAQTSIGAASPQAGQAGPPPGVVPAAAPEGPAAKAEAGKEAVKSAAPAAEPAAKAEAGKEAVKSAAPAAEPAAKAEAGQEAVKSAAPAPAPKPVPPWQSLADMARIFLMAASMLAILAWGIALYAAYGSVAYPVRKTMTTIAQFLAYVAAAISLVVALVGIMIMSMGQTPQGLVFTSAGALVAAAAVAAAMRDGGLANPAALDQSSAQFLLSAASGVMGKVTSEVNDS